MSSPYDSYNGGRGSSSRRRGGLSHWVPLVLTLTIATAGVAAWVWSQRNRDDDYDEYEDEDGVSNRPGGPLSHPTGLDYENADYGENPPYGATGTGRATGAGRPSISGPDGSSSAVDAAAGAAAVPLDPSSPPASGSGASGWGARMSGAIGGASRSSPQQWVGSAGKAVTAGVAAASAAVGGALASIREGDKDAYADHETWSEEVDKRKTGSAAAGSSSGGRSSGSKRRTVVLVVSADNHMDFDQDGFHEHASILSYIPRQTDFSKARIYVLIYAPGLKDASTLEAGNANLQSASLSSSFSNIADQPASPNVEPKTPSANAAFSAVNTQALALVEKESDIIPFTSTNGHANILHLLEPDVIYLQESLAGEDGAVVKQLQNWMRNDIVVVVGAESGYGGLADSDSEGEKRAGSTGGDSVLKWWQREDRVGRGRGIVVVDGMRVNDDWIRRVQGKE